MSCLSVFDHFVGLEVKKLIYFMSLVSFYTRKDICQFNPFQATDLFRYHLKTS